MARAGIFFGARIGDKADNVSPQLKGELLIIKRMESDG